MIMVAGKAVAAERTDRIFAATLEVLIEVGFDRLTMDAVATRARSSKATLYRHWPSKAELVTDAVRALRSQQLVAPPSGQSLRSDLIEFFSHFNDDASQEQVCMMRGLISACSTDQDLASAVRQQLIETKRQSLMQILESWRERGDIPHGTDLDFLVDVMPALVIYRHLITQEGVDNAFLVRLVDQVAIPLLTSRTPSATR